nr:hypothetical protein CFP56_04177 [Quercus suber]
MPGTQPALPGYNTVHKYVHLVDVPYASVVARDIFDVLDHGPPRLVRDGWPRGATRLGEIRDEAHSLRWPHIPRLPATALALSSSSHAGHPLSLFD